jgi:L-lactate dehydrogenase complex protein LldG
MFASEVADRMTIDDSSSPDTTTPGLPDLLARFVERAEPLGVRVGRVPNAAGAAARIAEARRDAGASWILLAEEARDAVPRLSGELTMAGVSWVVPGAPETTRDHPFGVSLAKLAVAETASVLLAEPTLEDRAIGMLTVAQLVLCPTAALVPSLDEAAPLLREIAPRPGGGYATLVTGPSRTADIERVLTVGVQGPARVEVLFVDDLGS